VFRSELGSVSRVLGYRSTVILYGPGYMSLLMISLNFPIYSNHIYQLYIRTPVKKHRVFDSWCRNFMAPLVLWSTKWKHARFHPMSLHGKCRSGGFYENCRSSGFLRGLTRGCFKPVRSTTPKKIVQPNWAMSSPRGLERALGGFLHLFSPLAILYSIKIKESYRRSYFMETSCLLLEGSNRRTSSVCLSSPRPTYLKTILSSGELFGSLWYTDRSMTWRVRVEEGTSVGGWFLMHACALSLRSLHRRRTIFKVSDPIRSLTIAINWIANSQVIERWNISVECSA
jgi:hypothetical protein